MFAIICSHAPNVFVRLFIYVILCLIVVCIVLFGAGDDVVNNVFGGVECSIDWCEPQVYIGHRLLLSRTPFIG